MNDFLGTIRAVNDRSHFNMRPKLGILEVMKISISFQGKTRQKVCGKLPVPT
jgi:hypothetical protein